MFTVMVTWADAPKRAERLDANGGTTTSRRFYATMFPTKEAAERAAHACLDGIDTVLRWRVAPF